MHRYVYGTTMQAGRLVLDLADMHQRTTQSYVRRPYGVGMLVAAHDQTGPHLFQTCPSGNYFEYVAMAIGARSQSAKTYLEKHFESFESCDLDELVKHSLKALSGCVTGDKELDAQGLTLAIVGKDKVFETLEGEQLQPYMDAIELEGNAAQPMDEGGVEEEKAPAPDAGMA
ncbi:unnamed protein product [Scytosiphon promiscuus]